MMYVDDDKYMKNLRKIIIDQVETIIYGLFWNDVLYRDDMSRVAFLFV